METHTLPDWRFNCQLTTAIQSIRIQLVACKTAAVEATNGVATDVFTSSFVDGALVNVWNKSNVN